MKQLHDQPELPNQKHFALEHHYQQALLEAIFDADPSALAVLIGTDLRYIFANPTYRYLLSDFDHELIGSRYFDARLHNGHPLYPEELQAVYATGKPFMREGVEHTFPDGARRIFTLQARRIDWGKEAGVLLILWDVTDQKRAEEALQASQDRLIDTLESTHDSFYALDREWRITYANRRYAELIGRDIQELIGKNFWEILPNYLGTPVEQYFQQVMETHRPVHFQSGGYYSTLWFDISVYPTQEGISVFATDRTQEKHAEKTLRESEERYRVLFNAMQEAMFVVEMILDEHDQPTDWRYLEVNPQTEHWMGMTRDQMIGRTYSEVVRHPDPAWVALLGKVAQTGTPINQEVYSPYRNRWLQVSAYALQAGRVAVVYHDITDNKQAEQTLREALQAASQSEERFATIFQKAPVMMTLGRMKDGVTVDVNQAFEKLFGFTKAEVIGRTTAELGIAPDPDQRNRLLEEFKRQGYLHQLEINYITKAGKPVVLSGNVDTIIIREEPYILSTYVDITERKQAEEGLAAAHRQIQNIIDNTPALVYALDLEERFILANSALAELLNVTPEQMIGKRRYEFMPKEDADWHEANDRQVIEAGKALEFEEYSQLDDRSITWLTTKFPLRDAQEKIYAVGGISADISDRKKAEQALKENQERLVMITEAADIGLWSLDTQTKALYLDQQTKAILGLDDTQLLNGVALAARIHPEDLVKVEGLVERIQREQERLEVEFRMNLAGGNQHWLYMRGQGIFDHEGQSKQLVGVVMDITGRRQLMEQVQVDQARLEVQRRLLEQREQERLQIARELHDGPMQEILGAIYAIQGMIATEADDHLTNGLRAVVETLHTQLSELRTYASELRPPTLAQFGLAKAIQSHIESYQSKHPNIQVHLQVSQSEELTPENIRLGLFRIYQEAMNNIAKHCQKAEVKVTFNKMDGIARLKITDDGPGFEPPEDWLVQARAGHLGLVGMRERAEAIGGRLEIESTPGRGTTIRVEVPLGEAS